MKNWIEIFSKRYEVLTRFESKKRDATFKSDRGKGYWYSYNYFDYTAKIKVQADQVDEFLESVEILRTTDVKTESLAKYFGDFVKIKCHVQGSRKLSKTPSHTTFKLIVKDIDYLEVSEREKRHLKIMEIF